MEVHLLLLCRIWKLLGFFLGVSEKGRGKIERGGFFGDFISIVLIFYCSSGKKANGILRYIFSITNERSKQHEESCTNT